MIYSSDPYGAGMEAMRVVKSRTGPGCTTPLVHLAALYAGWYASMVAQGLWHYEPVLAWDRFQAGAKYEGGLL